MLNASLPDHIGHLDFGTQALVELTQSNLDVRAQAREHIDALKQFSPELFLRTFGQVGGSQ
jgi:hypothetical protein